MNTVFYYPHELPLEEQKNIKKMAGHFGYEITCFVHRVSDLHSELVQRHYMLVMTWDMKSVNECKERLPFYNLMTQLQMRFYDFQQGVMHYPWATNYFKAQDFVGGLIGEEYSTKFYSVQ